MMAFLDVDDAATAIDIGSLLTSRSALNAFPMWAILALVCWWQIFPRKRADGKSWCRHSRSLQCQRRRNRRRNRRRKEQGKEWECPLTRLHNHLSNMPPPLPFHRRRTHRNRTESDSETKQENLPSNASSEEESQVTVEQTDKTSSKTPATILNPSPQVARTSAIDRARMQHWSRLVDHITSHRRDARQIDSQGLMPLHWACSGGPPLEAIEALLRAYPRAAKKTDDEGSTALHFACYYGGSAPVVRALLEAYPKAVYKKDKYGRTPLYHAVNKSSSLDVIKILVEANASMAIEPCVPPKSSRLNTASSHDSRPLHHRTPLFIAWAVVSPHQSRRRRRTGRSWEKAALLLEAAYNESTSSKVQHSFRMVRAAIKLDSFLPPRAIYLAIERFPDELRQSDELDGRLPLAIAADSPSPRAPEIIKLLCEAHPQAARASDLNGQTPLAIAVSSGKQWHQGVETIFQAAPDALNRRDYKFRLYPALVAASTPKMPHEEKARAVADESEENTTLMPLHPSSSFKNCKASHWRTHVLPNVNKGGHVLSNSRSNWEQVDADSRHLSTIYEMVRASPSLTQR